ncbi:MAG: ATP-binding protein, partial [Patulibacter sp.]|nr:ATP-binding protein [Patulibacter sp.]
VRLSKVERDLRERVMRESAGKVAGHAEDLVRKARRQAPDGGTLREVAKMLKRGLMPDGQRERDQLLAQDLLGQLHEYAALRTARPATSADIQWWVRRVYARGVGDPRVDDGDVPQGVLVERNGVGAVRPLEVDLLRWTGGVESGPRRPDHVVCTDGEGRTVVQQTLMATSWHPTADRAERSLGLAVVAPRGLDWPIDLSVTWEWNSNTASKRSMDRKSRETLEDARQEHGTQLGVSAGTGEAYSASQGLLARLEATGEPTLKAVVTASIAVVVDDEENPGDKRALAAAVRELRARSRATRDLIEQRCGVTFQVPPLQQVEAMQQMLPAQPPRLPGYGRIVMPDQIAAQGWTAGTEVGSHSGWVWARTQSRRPMPVRLDLADPARLKCAAGILWVGDSGGGKTFAVGAAMITAVLDGAWIVNEDPKGDHKWTRMLPDHLVEQIRLSDRNTDQHGMLDPWIVAAADRRAEVALSFLLRLLPSRTPEMEVALQEAVAGVEAADRGGSLGEAPTSWHVLNRLSEISDDPAAGLVYRSLTARAGHGLARLAFAEPGQRRAVLGRRQVTSIVSNSFDRPEAGVPREEWSDRQITSMALAENIGHLTTRLMDEQRADLKILNSDEAHATLATNLGRAQINSAQRMGRSELLVPSIATQAPSDLTDANLKNLFGAYVLFRAMSEEEAIAGLTLAGLPTDEEIVNKLVHLETGQALMRDHRGRTEWINVLAPQRYLHGVSEHRELETTDDELAAL